MSSFTRHDALGAKASWDQLLPALFCQVAKQMNPSEVSGALKLLNKASAEWLKGSPEFRKIRLAMRVPKWCSYNGKKIQNEYVVVAAQPWPRGAFLAHWGRPEPWRSLTLVERRRLLALAASSGDADSLDAALAHCGCSLTKDVFTAAAAAGRLAACRRLLAQGCDVDYAAALVAAAGAGLEQFTQLLELVQMDMKHLRAVGGVACHCGHAQLLQAIVIILEAGGNTPKVWQYIVYLQATSQCPFKCFLSCQRCIVLPHHSGFTACSCQPSCTNTSRRHQHKPPPQPYPQPLPSTATTPN